MTKPGTQSAAKSNGLLDPGKSIRNFKLSDATDDFDFVYPDTGERIEKVFFKFMDGVQRTDTWFSNKQELRNATDPWDPDTDDDGLTDGQEVKWVTRKSGVERGSLVRIDKEVTDSLDLNVPKDPNINREPSHVDPFKHDTDQDGEIDGGGFIQVRNLEIGEQSNGDGEAWHMPSSPSEPDVIHVLPATDEEFRNQHKNFNLEGYQGYKGYVRRIIDNTNDYLASTFSDVDSTPHLVIVTNKNGDWGEWDNPDPGTTDDSMEVYTRSLSTTIADSTIAEQRQLRDELEWPVRNSKLDRRGADVLSGFSGQPMGDPSADGIRSEVAGQFIDASSGTAEGSNFDSNFELTGGVTIIGTNDPGFVTNTDTVDNYYLHELGHVLGAIHPGDVSDDVEFSVPPGTPGVMCKDSCVPSVVTELGLETYINSQINLGLLSIDLPDTEWIMSSEKYSEPNKHRILNLDYDYKDRSSEGLPADGNEARNLKSVSTSVSNNG